MLYFQTDTDVQLIISAYNTVCGSGAECTAALNAYNADTSCRTAIADNDSGTYCTGTCRTLLSAVFSACPDVSSGIDMIIYTV